MYIIFGIQDPWHPSGGAFDFVELINDSDENVAINKAIEYYHLPSQKYKYVHVLDIIKTMKHKNGKKMIIWNSVTEERKLKEETMKKSEELKCSNYLEKKKQELLKNEVKKDCGIVNEIMNENIESDEQMDKSKFHEVYTININDELQKRLYD